MTHSPAALLLVCAITALSLVACPPSQRNDEKSSAAPCARVGQNCEVSPGKLGTCVTKDGCTDQAPGATCFVCQSQH